MSPDRQPVGLDRRATQADTSIGGSTVPGANQANGYGRVLPGRPRTEARGAVRLHLDLLLPSLRTLCARFELLLDSLNSSRVSSEPRFLLMGLSCMSDLTRPPICFELWHARTFPFTLTTMTSPSTFRLQTRRLILRPRDPAEDAAPMLALYSSPHFLVHSPGTYTLESSQFIRRWRNVSWTCC